MYIGLGFEDVGTVPMFVRMLADPPLNTLLSALS
jgi:hypothetical protein